MLSNKRVLVNGCSFSRGKIAWPYHLQEKLNFDLVNLAMTSAGNLYIHNSTITELAQRNYDLVIIMWSGIERVDCQVDDISLFSHMPHTSTYYSKHNDWPGKNIYPINDQDYVEKDWVFVCNYSWFPELQKMKFCETNFKYQGYKQKLTQSLIHMISLQSILKQMNIPYVFSFYNNYHADLEQHNLYKMIDVNNIITDNNIHDITKRNNWFEEDGLHPNTEAHSKWTDILYNHLITKTYA